MKSPLIVVALVVSSGCAPLFKVAHEAAHPTRLPDGVSQGPFRIRVPLEPSLPHRLQVTLESRCAPEWRVELHQGGSVSEHQLGGLTGNPWLDAFEFETPRWQQHLRAHFLDSVQAQRLETAPSPHTSPDQPQLRVATRVDSTQASTRATVSLPGYWQVTPSADEQFELARQKVCATSRVTQLSSGIIDPGTSEVTYVLWSEVPQVLEDAQLTVDVSQLQAPELKKERQSSPPHPWAVWVSGSWEWQSKRGDWSWAAGRWATPQTPPVPPPPEPVRSAPPHPWAVWHPGSWTWDSASNRGWVWLSGQWQTPASPPGPAPAPKEEVRSSPPHEWASWQVGAWQWQVPAGWVWLSGHWYTNEKPTGPAPAAKAETPGRPPNEWYEWASGNWQWSTSQGWFWVDGHWVFPEKPTRRAPALRVETPGTSAPTPWHRWWPGQWEWQLKEGWVWQEGSWYVPSSPTEPAPPAKIEDRGRPPNEWYVWRDGRWEWEVGWVWISGRWALPALPTKAPPPLKNEDPGKPKSWWFRWKSGSWRWDASVGYVWVGGYWWLPETPPPVPPPQDEASRASRPPRSGVVWSPGFWRWLTSYGYEWVDGRWVPAREAEPAPEAPPIAVAQPPAPEPSCTRRMGAPPDAKHEAPPTAPAPGAVWVAGMWRWSKCEWAWQRGEWKVPPAPNMRWVPGETIDLGHWVTAIVR